jgi:hypothetical protein
VALVMSLIQAEIPDGVRKKNKFSGKHKIKGLATFVDF